jgi:hypothetical protein
MKTSLFFLPLKPFILRTLGIALFAIACSEPDIVPSKDASGPSQDVSEVQEGNSSEFGRRWHRDTVNYNLDVILLGPGKGFGYVKFRQNKNEPQMIHLDTWVLGLQPNARYQLQRAVDTVLDGNCTSSAWLTLGKGLDPQSIITNNWGSGSAELFRSVAAIPVGSTFDIHFRIVKENTEEVVLSSSCYEYTVR